MTSAVDLGDALVVFSTNLHDPIDLNSSVRNHNFETEIMHDCPFLIVIESAHIFHFGLQLQVYV